MYKIHKFNSFGIEQISIIKDNGNSYTSFPADPNIPEYQQYLLWLEEGNTPLPPDPIPEPEPLTAQQKLEAAGLTVEELKGLLGL